MLNINRVKHRKANAGGLEVFYREAGRSAAPAVLLLHGFPSSSYEFRNVMSPLAEVARVIAPDLPGFGYTEAGSLEEYPYTFDAMTRTVDSFLNTVGLERFFLYIHDFGAPVAYNLALARPDRVLGLIIQNGNSHQEGLGIDWDGAKAYWTDPTAENKAKLPHWLNFEGTRQQYVGGIPDRIKPLLPPESWHLDWERMSRPGLVDIQFKIFDDYKTHVARFDDISAYHKTHQPPSVLLWGRHDTYFQVEEVLSYSRELDRLDMHIFDGAHFLLETHHEECAAIIRKFVEDTIEGY